MLDSDGLDSDGLDSDGLDSSEACDDGSSLAELYARYVDRLNRGESLDPDEILAAHPKEGAELLEMLDCFVGPEADLGPRPTQLGDYTLARRIGRGGMGVVYDAWQHSMDRRVALKILPAGIAADSRAYMRFMREAQVAGQLSHPNVVPVHGLGIEEHTPYYAMEYVEGETLAQILSRIKDRGAETDTPFGPKDEVDYFVRIARAFGGVAAGLHHAHSKGIVHRDIKPSNLILDPEERLRILDFGLARLEGQETVTISGDLIGTPLYMSPEQVRRKKIDIDHRTDIYSLGATMYEVLCGRPPFRGKDHADTVSQIIERDPTEPSRINSRLPKDLETIVVKCLRKDVRERYGTAEAVAQELARFVRGEPIEAKPEVGWARLARRVRRQRARWIVMAIVLATTVLVSWLALSSWRAASERELALYPGRLRDTVGKLDSGAWVLQAASPPLSSPGIDFRVFEPGDFRDVLEIAGERTIREAIAELRDLTASCPREPEAYFHLGRAYAVTDHTDLALRELDRAIEVDPGFLAAAGLRAKLQGEKLEGAPSSTPGASRGVGAGLQDWAAVRNEAERLQWEGEHSEAAELWTRLIDGFEDDEAPYSGFLTECYLKRASARAATREYDLAEEDCVRARAKNPASLVSELLLARVYLLAKKPELARHAFDRLRSRSEIRDVLPFWVASVHLSVAESDLSEALGWAGSVQDAALRERLTTYLHLRLSQWDRAVAAGERAVAADPDGLVPRQLLASAHLQRLSQRGESNVTSAVELAEACREAIQLDPRSRRSGFLVRAAWELLRPRSAAIDSSDDNGELARTVLAETARRVGLTLLEDVRERSILDDFTADSDIQDGRPFRWRVIRECCPAEVETTPAGLRVTKLGPEKGYDAWLVTEEVFSGDSVVRVRVDVGEGKVFCNLHVDLGTASLYYAGVSLDGRSQLGRLQYGESRVEVEGSIGALTGDVVLELRTVGEFVESRVWLEGSERPDEPTLVLKDSALRLGSVGVSTTSHPACFRWVGVETAVSDP